ncbi:MAG: triose-phosphate isomerase [Holosporales bacterium]|jgi:triosephosphate isomerase|nr:triose-phosphate isomerase [Holosporales bacterium]
MAKIIIGNWKMNGSRELINEFRLVLEDRRKSVQGLRGEISSEANIGVICVPYPFIFHATQTLSGFIFIGAQDCSQFAAPGAYTGDVSAQMLREAGATYVILGHSERRRLHSESDELIAQKFAYAVEAQLIPIVCVGESRQDYERKSTHEVLAQQISFLKSVNEKFYVAYEPIWAIGTGMTPTLDEINDAHSFIFEMCGRVPIYGGSVTTQNYKQILEISSVQGLLIGKESLDPGKFTEIFFYNDRAPNFHNGTKRQN